MESVGLDLCGMLCGCDLWVSKVKIWGKIGVPDVSEKLNEWTEEVTYHGFIYMR